MKQHDLLAVLFLGDRFARAALHEHEGGANHLHIAPVGLLHDVGGQARGQFVVCLPNVGQSAINLLDSSNVWAGLQKVPVAHAAMLLVLEDLLAVGGFPFAVANNSRPIVPQVIGKVHDQLHELFGWSQLLGDSAHLLWRSSVHNSPPLYSVVVSCDKLPVTRFSVSPPEILG